MEIQQFADANRLKTRIDVDGTKIIPGKLGHSHLYEYDGVLMGAMVMPNPPRKQYWTYVKAVLVEAGCEIVQDGYGEGAVTFDPKVPEQVKVAIKACKVRKRRIATPEQLDHLAKFRFKPL